MDAYALINQAKAFNDKLDDEPIFEIGEGDGQKFIQVHPSKIFPFKVLLNYSLVDGKPRAEFDSADGGPHGKNGEPSLRIDVNDGDAWEDRERWPRIPHFEDDPDDINIGVRYLSPDRERISRMWRMVTDSHLGDDPNLDMVIAYATATALHAGTVVGYGSKFMVQDQDGKLVQDITREQVIATMLIAVDE